MIKVSTFADRLKSYRDEADITLKDLEELTGVPAQTLNRYELGQRIPKVDMAGAIAEKLGVSSLWLQGYDVPVKNIEDTEFDSDIRAIQRAANRMDQKKRQKMLQLLKISFEEEFKEDDE